MHYNVFPAIAYTILQKKKTKKKPERKGGKKERRKVLINTASVTKPFKKLFYRDW